jgi:hypothetical protein
MVEGKTQNSKELCPQKTLYGPRNLWVNCIYPSPIIMIVIMQLNNYHMVFTFHLESELLVAMARLPRSRTVS